MSPPPPVQGKPRKPSLNKVKIIGCIIKYNNFAVNSVDTSVISTEEPRDFKKMTVLITYFSFGPVIHFTFVVQTELLQFLKSDHIFNKSVRGPCTPASNKLEPIFNFLGS